MSIPRRLRRIKKKFSRLDSRQREAGLRYTVAQRRGVSLVLIYFVILRIYLINDYDK